MKVSTDIEIFEKIFSMYASDFEAAQSLPDKDGNRIYVPINTREVASLLGDNPQYYLAGSITTWMQSTDTSRLAEQWCISLV